MLDILILQTSIQKELKNCWKFGYDGIELPVQEKDFNKIEVKNNICINMFRYENGMVFPIYVSDQKFDGSIDLLLLIDVISHIMCTSKILKDLCLTKQKIKTKNSFIGVAFSVLVVKVCWENIKKILWALMVNSK